jgi:hypothetical protein
MTFMVDYFFVNHKTGGFEGSNWGGDRDGTRVDT